MSVIQRFLSVRGRRIPTPNPFDGNFGVHFTALCDLLRAFGELSGKPERWSEDIIAEWDHIIRPQQTADGEEHEFEYHIREILESQSRYSPVSSEIQPKQIQFNGQEGKLYVTNSGFLFGKLSERP